MSHIAAFKEIVMPDSACRICGCTENAACEPGCSWVEDPENIGPLCSKCRDNRSWEIPFEQIRPAPWNPKSRMDPAKVNGLADSIKKEGQKQNALVRPVTETLDSPVKYELVFGHRRYAARQLLAQKVAALGVLRCEIQEMEEEQAMIIAGIENLQRENFSDLEEAEFFRTCSDRYGESAIKVLSERLSVSHRYIRKRLEILKLPKGALELWRAGTWHVGHMEQLLRLGDNENVMDFLGKVDNRRLPGLRVWELADMVGRQALSLHSGHFDKTECKGCQKNTDCQHRLFDLAKEKGAKCLDQKCFTAKQQAWLDVNWPTCKENKYGTQAAIIGDSQTQKTGEFSNWGDPKPGKKCQSCPKYMTILALSGHNNAPRAYRERVCMGDAACFAEVCKEGKKGQKAEKGGKDPEGPRVPWHGEHYRQEFYRQEIPRLMESLSKEDPRPLQLALATLVHSTRALNEWLCEQLGVDPPKKEQWENHACMAFHQILKLARSQTDWQAEWLMAAALVKIALENGERHEIIFSDQDRQALAEFLDIDFSRYQVTEEYLQKKTKAELVRFIIHESGLMEEAKFNEFMAQHGYKTPEKLAQAKKGALVELILECQVDLHGRLPKEIADRPQLEAVHEHL